MRAFKLITLAFIVLALTAVKSAWAVTEFVSIIRSDGQGTSDYSSLNAWNTAVACDLTAAGTKVFTGTLTNPNNTVIDGVVVTLYRGGVSQGITATVLHYNGTQLLVQNISNTSFSFALNDVWEADSLDYVTISSVGDSAIATAQINGTWSSPETAPLSLSSPWNTSATNYIKIYTVGSAAAQGKWTSTAYSLVVNATVTDAYAINIDENYVQITGLQISLLNNVSTNIANSWAINIPTLTGATNITISKNIITSALSGSGNTNGWGIVSGAIPSNQGGSAVFNIYDNIIYGLNTVTGGIWVNGGSNYIYNNTVYNNSYGIDAHGGTVIVANNLSINNGGHDYAEAAFSGTTVANADYSDDGTSPDGGADQNKSVSFVNASGGDFHLASADTSGAQNGGKDLSAIFPDDIESINRGTGTEIWSVGASQYGDTWTDNNGAGDNNWFTASNWSSGSYPTSGVAAIFKPAYNYACNISGATVNIQSIDVLYGYTQTITPHSTVILVSFSQAAGTFNAGNISSMTVTNFIQTGGSFTAPITTLLVSGNWTYSGGTFTPGSGTVNFDGASAQAFTAPDAVETFNNVATSNTSSLTIGSTTDSLNISGNLTLGSGTTLALSGALANINVAGNWINNGGTFTPGTGTITLNGTGQSISGSTTFYNLSKTVTSADTLTFASGTTQTIAAGGTLSLNGASSQLLALRSSSSGVQYNITLDGVSSVSYCDIKDANASGGYTIPASYSVDSGNNTNWLINSGLITAVKVWKGTTSSAWATNSNWQLPNGTVSTAPSSTEGVLINGSYTTAPVISAADVTIAALVMSGASTLTVQRPGVSPGITVSGNVSISGTSNLTHSANSSTEVYKLNMSVGGNFTLGSTATINVTGDGYAAGNGPGVGTGPYWGGSYGGIGNVWVGTVGPTYGSMTAPVNIGSGGGQGGSPGGGAVILNISGAFIDSGTISANGSYNSTNNTSGSGGSVYITTGTISGTGAISANGGNNVGVSGGGGGRVSLILNSSGANFSGYSGTVTAYGGTANNSGYGNGAAGTVYEQTQAQGTGAGTLTINNNNAVASEVDGNATRITTLMPTGTNLSNLSNIIIAGDGNLGINTDTTINFGTNTITGNSSTTAFITIYGYNNVTFPSAYTMTSYTLNLDEPLTITGDWALSGTGILAHSTNFNSEAYKLNLTVTGNLTLNSAVSMIVDSDGYATGNGPGAGTGGAQYVGGSYGGIGNLNYNTTPGATYGSITAPINLGSGGYTNSGGGAIILNISGAFNDNGGLSANGGPTTNTWGAGSGGSVYINTGTISGSGAISANGGGSNNGNGSGGGGGRVAIILNSSGANFSGYSGTVSAYGGITSNGNGAAGTVYEQTQAQGAGAGILTINNNNVLPNYFVGIRITTLMPTGTNLNNFSNIIISGDGNLGVNTDTAINFGTANITGSSPSTAFITLYGNTSTPINTTNVVFPSAYTMNNYTLYIDGPLSINGNWTLSGTGVLTHDPNYSTGAGELYKLNLTVTGNLTLNNGVSMNVVGNGYAEGNGPGLGAYPNASSYGGDGSYWPGWSTTLGSTYGSITAPINLGSGGGYASNCSGGGAVILNISGLFNDSSTISANASNNGVVCSGSGGSVYITTGTISGTGAISANGGTTYNNGWAGGGGGRIAIILNSLGANFSSYSGTVTAYGGGSGSGNGNNGAAGTIYEQTQAQGAGGGNLIIDNNSTTTISGVVTDISSGVTGTTVGAVTLQNTGLLTIESGKTLTTGNVTINSNATLTNLGTLVATGNWSQASTGTFVAGTTATLSGNDLITGLKIASGTLTLSPGYTYTVTDGSIANGITVASGAAINFNGSSDNSLLTLRSSTTGDTWYLNNLSGSTTTANYVDVEDSTATTSVTPTNSINSGNDVNWTFPTNTKLWLGTSSSAWSNPANWSNDSVPATTDIVAFEGAHNNPCNMDASHTVGGVVIGASYTSTISLNTNTLTINGSADFTGGTLNAGTSTIIFSGATSPAWTLGGQTYYNVNIGNTSSGNYTLSGTGTISNILTVNTSSAINGGSISLTGTGTGTNSAYISTTAAGGTTAITMAGATQDINTIAGTLLPLTISGGNTTLSGDANLQTVNVNSSKTLNFVAGDVLGLTNTVTDQGILNFNPGTYTITAGQTVSVAGGATLNFTGTDASDMVVLQSNSAATWNLTKNGTVTANWVDVAYSSSSDTITAYNSINEQVSGVSTNTNWIFNSSGAGKKWVAVSPGSWNTASNWIPAAVPTSTDNVIFNSGSAACSIDSTAQAASVTVASGYSGTITQNASLTVSGALVLDNGTFNSNGQALSVGSYSQSVGTFTGGSSTITDSGNWTLSGGTYTSTSNTLNIAGNWSQSGGVFIHNNGTVNFSASSPNTQSVTIAQGATGPFYNLTHSGSGTLQAVPLSFSYSRPITISASMVPTGNIETNFPVLVNVSDASFGTSANKVQSSGNDFLFTDANGNKLPHEIESFTQSSGSGALTAWVKVPALSSSSNTTIYLYYGNPTCASQQYAAGVWDANFQSVYHMGNDVANTAVTDSTSNANTGTSQQNTSALSTTGQIGAALTFNGSSDYISTTNQITDPQTFTIGAWFNTSSSAGGKLIGFENAQTGTGSTSFDRMLYVGTNGKLYFAVNGGSSATISTSGVINNGTWHYAVGVFSANTMYLYLDSSLVGSLATSAALNYNGYWRMGSYKLATWPNAADGYYNGSIDEVKISSSARTSDWITTEYNNQKNPSMYETLGTEGAATAPAMSIAVAGALANSNGTLNLNNNNIFVAGNFNTSGGTFTPGTASVTLNGTSGTQTLTSAGQSLYGLSINAPGATVSPDNLTVTNALTLSAGTLSMGTSALNLGGASLTQNGGTFAAGTVTLSGSSTITGLDIASGTLTFSGGYTYTVTDGSIANGITVASGAGINFDGISDNNLLVTLRSSSGGTAWYLNNVAGSTTTGSYLDVEDSTATSTITPTNSINSGNNINWTFSSGSTKLWLGTSSSAWSNPANWSGDAVPANTDIIAFEGVHNNPCSIDSNYTVGGVVVASTFTSTISLNANTLTVAGSADFTGGTFNPGTGTIIFSGGAGPTWTMGGQTYHNVTFDNTASGNYTLSGSGTVSNALVLNTTSAINGTGVTLGGATLTGTSANGGTAVINWTGAPNGAWNSGAAVYPYLKFDNPSATTTLSAGLTANSLEVANGVLNGNGQNISINGSNGSFIVSANSSNSFIAGTNGTLTLGSATSSPSWTQSNSTAASYYNVINNDTTAVSLSTGIAYNIGGNLTLNSSSSLNNASTLNLSGNLFVSGASTGTAVVNINNTTTAQSINASSGVVPSLTLGNTSQIATITGTNAVLGNITIDSGALTFNPGNYTITAGDTMSVLSGAILNFSGTDDSSNLVVLRSSSTGQAWHVNNAGGSTITANFTDVEDSHATNLISTSNSTDSGDNVNWSFAPAVFSNWSLDMTAKTMTLNFSNGVKPSTLSIGQITLLNSNGSVSYTLTNSTTASSDGKTAVINLSTVDFNAISDTSGLCDSLNDSYITFTSTAIKNLNGTYVTGVSEVQATTYNSNTTAAAYFRITTSGGANTTTTTAGTAITGAIIKTYDINNYRVTGYSGHKILLFSSVIGTTSPSGNVAQASDYTSTNINFGTDTTLNFSLGTATFNLLLYSATSGTPVQLDATEDNDNPVLTEINYDLQVTVNHAIKNKLVFVTPASASTGVINIALNPQPQVAITDLYGNQTTDTDAITFYASSSNSVFLQASGTLTLGSNPVSAVNGLATTSGLQYSKIGVIYLQAQDSGLTSAFSSAITFSYAATSTVIAAVSPVANFNLNPVNDTLGQKFAALNFQVMNSGGDGVATILDQIKIAITGTGGNASTDIAWAGLYKGVTQIATATGSAITNAYITFGAPSGPALDSVADGTSTQYTLYIYMKNSKLTATDTQTYIFDTNETLTTADSTGNQMVPSSTGQVAAVIGTISVIQTYYDILSQASGLNSFSATAGTPVAITIMATDVNKNIATSYGGPTGANKILVFTGLSSINGNVPNINSVAFGSDITLSFVNGVTTSSSVNLTAYDSQTATISAAEVGVSPAYSVYTGNVTVTSGAAATIAYVSGSGQTAIVDNALTNPLVAYVTDAYTNPVIGQSVTYAVSTFPAGATGYSFSPSSVNTDSGGHATAYFTLGNAGGSYVAQASVLVNGNPISGSPVSFNASATQPAALVQVSGGSPEQSTTIGTALSSPFVVALQDINSVGVSGQPVTFSIFSDPGGTTGASLSTTSATTDVNGQASTTLTMGILAGTYVVKASYSGVNPALTTNFSSTALAGTPYKVVLTGPSAVNAGSPSSAYTVTVEDLNGNPSNVNANTVFNLSTNNVGGTSGFYSDSGATQSITSVTIPSGSSSVQFYYKQTDAANITLTAQWASGDTRINSSFRTGTINVSILPAGISYFIVTGSGSSLTAGGTVSVTVTAYDINNNLSTNYTATTAVVFSGANVSPSGQAPTAINASAANIPFGTNTTLSFIAGVATTTVKLYKAESALIAVTAGSVTTSAGNSLAEAVANSTPDHLAFQGNITTPQTAGNIFSLGATVAGVDLYGNVCESANNGPVYSGNKTLSWTLSGQSNGPVSGTDSFVTAVNFVNGISTTALTATLYRAQTTTMSASDAILPGVSAPSNSIVINPAALNGMRFLQEPPATMAASDPFVPQPQVSLADAYGNTTTNKSAAITLTASLSGTSYVPVVNGSLLGNSLTLSTTNGVAAYSNVRYTYPEVIYLQASAANVTGGVSLPDIYSTAVSSSTAQELSVSSSAGVSAAISSIANTLAQAVNVMDFQITNGPDGLAGNLTQIVINRDTTTDTSGGWTNYLSGAYITDGTTQILGVIQNNIITFGTGSSTIYSIPNSTSKTFSLTLVIKSSLPVGACDKVLAFKMTPASDITLSIPTTNTFNLGASPVITSSSTLKVVATKLVVGGSTASVNAGTSRQITITAQDKNNNIDLDYNYTTTGMSIIFSGADVSASGNNPTATDYTGAAKNFGIATYIQFTNGVSSSVINMILYKAESVSITATDVNGLTASSPSDKLSFLVNGGSGTQLLWNTQPKSTIAANAPWNPFVVAVTDTYGNTASNNSLITVTPSTGISLSPGASNQVTSSNGLATFSSFAVNSSNNVYPQTLTLTASASGLTSTPASILVTLAQNYTINLTVEDSLSASLLSGFSFSATDANGATVVPSYTPTTNPFSISLPYGTYTFSFSLSQYVNLNASVSANVAADAADGIYDNTINLTEGMTSTIESNANYSVESNFAYNEITQTLTIRMWLTRLGKTVINNGINDLGTATISIVDPFGNTLAPINLPAPSPNDYSINGATYQVTIPNVLSANNILGQALVAGGTYFANCVINYGGTNGLGSSFQNGTQFTLTITEALAQNVVNAIGEPQGQTISSQIQAAQTSITNAVTSAQSSLASQVSAVQTDTQQIVNTIPTLITTGQTNLVNILEAKILNSETNIAQGNTLTIRYRTATGLSPKIDVYSPKNVQLITKAVMKELGATGIYSYPLLFQASWGRGDFTIVCTEATKGTLDSYTVTVTNSDIDQVNNNVSAVLGTTSGLGSISQAAASLNSQISVIESALNQLTTGPGSGGNTKTSPTGSMEALYTQLQGLSKQIQGLSSNQGLNLDKLFKVSSNKQQDIEYLKNKTQELKTAVDMSENMIDNIANKPIVQEVYEYSK